jgi:hypothetical protein
MTDKPPSETLSDHVTATGVFDLLNYAWTIICNVNNGYWQEQSEEWQRAAANFRTQYHALLDKAHPQA